MTNNLNKLNSEFHKITGIEDTDISVLFSHLYDRDLKPDIQALIEINTELLNCTNPSVADNPKLAHYFKVQNLILQFYTIFMGKTSKEQAI